MKKLFLFTLLLILVGNLLITAMEKMFFNSDSILEVQKNILIAPSNANVSNIYPASLLFTKMMIWITTFTLLSICIHFIKLSNKNILRNIIIGFYLVGCITNVLIVPHPLWFVLTTVAIVIVPFIITPELIVAIQNGIYFDDILANTNNKSRTTQPV